MTWTVEQYGDGDSLVIHQDADNRVCFMATAGRLGDPDQIERNAHLIAAAPEMLSALEGAAEWLKDWASAEPYLSAIEAAIAKARGESQ